MKQKTQSTLLTRTRVGWSFNFGTWRGGTHQRGKCSFERVAHFKKFIILHVYNISCTKKKEKQLY